MYVSKLDRFHADAKHNKWMRYFTVFTRVALAAGFLPSGFTKIVGERFTALADNHPMGAYLEALHHTGYYYPFIGYLQVFAAILLLIPRTATLGALIYFPIILNICILSLAVCFEGSLLTSPLMVIANIYLLLWDYDRLKFIVFKPEPVESRPLSSKFPIKFFTISFVAVVAIVAMIVNAYEIMPKNVTKDCLEQCDDKQNPEACADFCDCIHTQGKSYDDCLLEYRSNIKKQ